MCLCSIGHFSSHIWQFESSTLIPLKKISRSRQCRYLPQGPLTAALCWPAGPLLGLGACSHRAPRERGPTSPKMTLDSGIVKCSGSEPPDSIAVKDDCETNEHAASSVC